MTYRESIFLILSNNKYKFVEWKFLNCGFSNIGQFWAFDNFYKIQNLASLIKSEWPRWWNNWNLNFRRGAKFCDHKLALVQNGVWANSITALHFHCSKPFRLKTTSKWFSSVRFQESFTHIYFNPFYCNFRLAYHKWSEERIPVIYTRVARFLS